jgi:hypothetical protein
MRVVYNNRKSTRGRIVQVVTVPLLKGYDPIAKRYIPNPHKNAGKTVQIRHIK